MALKWFDGLEQFGVIARMTEGVGGGAAWSEVDTSNFSLSTANPATQTYHLRLQDTATSVKRLRRIFGISTDVAAFGYRFSVEDLPSRESYNNDDTQLVMMSFNDVANDHQCRISLGTDGSIYACRNDTLLGRSNPCVAPGGYHHIECKVKIANSGGYIEVRVNEVTVLNLTGIDTQTTSNAETSQVVVRLQASAIDSTVGFVTMDMDDFFAWDDDASDATNTVVDFVGDKGVYLLKPNADTATAGWAKSTGVTGYTLIDEVPPANTDYLVDTTGAAKSIFGVESLPGNVAEVIAMTPLWYGRKEESGTVTIRAGLNVGTDETYGPDDSPSTGYAYGRQGPKTIDPDTGVAWASDAEPELIIDRTA